MVAELEIKHDESAISAAAIDRTGRLHTGERRIATLG